MTPFRCFSINLPIASSLSFSLSLSFHTLTFEGFRYLEIYSRGFEDWKEAEKRGGS